ncbi:uncharacterized protein UV8b_06545 [Ustilaginoidea virens]|uniref:Uncharacterized protein n=1 Tax=Ustilaginoidea virens TaxID=1159556 RepID=A0A8E5HW36_USTVR|nr:uncharacterized protein UV8b_06545 [Ustilaginoidea virens]QUC22304.1 hypothetical protein UV8b_06545 [Ustilaginoidea virens]
MVKNPQGIIRHIQHHVSRLESKFCHSVVLDALVSFPPGVLLQLASIGAIPERRSCTRPSLSHSYTSLIMPAKHHSPNWPLEPPSTCRDPIPAFRLNSFFRHAQS